MTVQTFNCQNTRIIQKVKSEIVASFELATHFVFGVETLKW